MIGKASGIPLVSVIIPAYNHERFIGAAVASVLEQSLDDFELIVIDDGSTDRTGEIVKSQSDPRLTYIYQDNQDAPATINRGLNLARGRFIAILNSDDLYHKKRLERLVAVQAASGAACLFTDLDMIDENGGPLAATAFLPWWLECKRQFYREHHDLFASLISGNIMVTTSNLFMTAEAAQRVGPFARERYCHDYDYILRMILTWPGQVHYLIGEKLLAYRLHGGNTIHESRALSVEQERDLLYRTMLTYLPDDKRLAMAEVLIRLVSLHSWLQNNQATRH